ncbi:NACHT domain-containing NTPase [Paraburkholderia phymatum]|uniref:NACHT domain-containing NTPase n=1 Tax=Paraburkholderia phymatum TaxID=148447 RepID=A0ACC6U5B7_9BURK
MPVLRIDIERALDELASQEEGMRFQGLSVVLGKKRWPELIARQRKKDFGLDAYAAATLTPEKIGKGLAASITPTLKKISDDAKTAKEHFPDLKALLFVTPAKVGNADRKKWEKAIYDDLGLDLHIIEREEIVTQMMMPENASLRASFLRLDVESEPQIVDLIEKTRRAADAITRTWAGKTKGHPLIDLAVVRLDSNGAESAEVLSLEQIGQALSQSRRIVLEGPAGRGKTTTLIQLAQRAHAIGTAFIVELPAWTSSHRGILDYIAGMPAFQTEGLTAADLARVQRMEPFMFLLNGWNEIAESNSAQANNALRELERDFPGAGIIVATRTYHLTPPLPGALRLRLLRLRRVQRAAYLAARLGERDTELCARIDAEPSLDELTRTPFILSEVASLFEAGAEIPSSKIGILAEVLRLQEHRDEHRNALQAAPTFGLQKDYLKALATKMTRGGAVALPDADARAVVAAVARELANLGQIEPVGAPALLATLTAHHVLERVDYPQAAFKFEHQQLQEYYAALDLRARLVDLLDDDHDTTGRFTADYVNDPAWAEPLRMICETFSEQTGNDETDKKNTSAGGKLVAMALAVDLVFAGELAQLCGAAVWSEVSAAVSERFRVVCAIQDGSFRQYALAAMLATGADDFSDIIVPLLSSEDQQTRFRTYRLWPDIQVSSIGSNWREQVRGWSEEAREDFVSELLHHRADDEIAAFAVEDNSIAVKKAAATGLMWTGSDDALTRVLESMDAQTFEDLARENFDRMPASLRQKTVAAMRKLIESTTDHPQRLRTALHLIELGDTGLDGVIKDAMVALPGGDMHNLGSHYIQPALEYLRKSDPVWVSAWVAVQIAEGVLYGHEYWLPFVTAIPDGIVEGYLHRLETENLTNARFHGMATVIAAGANAPLAARVFTKLHELRRKVDEEHGQPHEFEWQIIGQFEAVFHHFSGDVAAAGVLLSVTNGDPFDIKVAAALLTKVARSDAEPFHIADNDLKARVRAYLKGSVDLVLGQDDFTGQEKANLASAIAQVGMPEDMADLVTLIRADIDRMRRGQAARAAGDRGPLGNGAGMCYAGWHVAAAMHLAPPSAEQVLIDLLPEPEYLSDVAAAMARNFVPKPDRLFEPTLRYDLIWGAREGRVPPPVDDQQRTRFAAALNAEIKRLREQNEDGKSVVGLKDLAKALAAIDGRGSTATVLEVIVMPGQWDQYTRLDTAERLLVAGVVLPMNTLFALVDSFLERTQEWMHDSDRYLLRRILALCPFVDDPAAGIAKMRDVLAKRRLWAHELGDLITALGESRSNAAVELLYELASDAPTFEECEKTLVNALSTLDTPRARELLRAFVDPDIHGITLRDRPHRHDVLVARLAELAQKRPEVAARLRELCERDLQELNRHFISKIMNWLGTSEALTANLHLIDDTKPAPVPQGVWEQLETAFVERRPYEQDPNVFTQHARASNELRVRLFRMAYEDDKRRKSACMLLGQIEEWRLEYGRPTGEPRHPDLSSGQPWPPRQS